jgi:hypothetical protein
MLMTKRKPATVGEILVERIHESDRPDARRSG